MIQAYVFAGASGSGRRAVMADLAATGLATGAIEGPLGILLPPGEVAQDFPGATVHAWGGLAEGAALPELPGDLKTLFILLDGRADPVDQFESLARVLAGNPQVELARLLTVASCRFFSENPALASWLDACVRFSDVVLLCNREGVPNKWISDLTTRFHKECYPCLFAFVKDGKVANPAEVLYPEPRRMSLAYDFAEEAPAAVEEEADYEIVDETEDEEEGEVLEADGEEAPPAEPYFERDAAGRRKLRLPDVRDFLK
jgi:hypothetical protein